MVKKRPCSRPSDQYGIDIIPKSAYRFGIRANKGYLHDRHVCHFSKDAF